MIEKRKGGLGLALLAFVGGVVLMVGLSWVAWAVGLPGLCSGMVASSPMVGIGAAVMAWKARRA